MHAQNTTTDDCTYNQEEKNSIAGSPPNARPSVATRFRRLLGGEVRGRQTRLFPFFQNDRAVYLDSRLRTCSIDSVECNFLSAWECQNQAAFQIEFPLSTNNRFGRYPHVLLSIAGYSSFPPPTQVR